MMMIEILQELRELQRCFHNLLQEGEIMEASDDARLYKVNFGGLEVPNIMQMSPSTSAGSDSSIPLKPGNRVMVAAPSGDLKRGKILGSVPKEKRTGGKGDYFMQLPNGGEIRVDAKTGSLTVKLPKGATLQIEADSLMLKGNLSVDGNITCKALDASGDIKGKTITSAKGISLDEHIHSAPGGKTGPSEPGGA